MRCCCSNIKLTRYVPTFSALAFLLLGFFKRVPFGIGWRALADSVGAAVSRVPAAARADLTIVGANYGRAGALAFFRTREGIPYPISTAGDFWAWGPGTASGAHAIVVADSATVDRLHQLYQSVEVVRIVENPLGVTEEQRVWIFYATKPTVPLAMMWPKLGPNWD